MNIYAGNNSLTYEEYWRILSEREDLTDIRLMVYVDFSARGTHLGNTADYSHCRAVDNAFSRN